MSGASAAEEQIARLQKDYNNWRHLLDSAIQDEAWMDVVNIAAALYKIRVQFNALKRSEPA